MARVMVWSRLLKNTWKDCFEGCGKVEFKIVGRPEYDKEKVCMMVVDSESAYNVHEPVQIDIERKELEKLRKDIGKILRRYKE